MEFSFGTQKWLPVEELHERQEGVNDYALGLHASGFFDKVLNVQKCLLQSEAANTVLAIVQDCWRDPELGLSPYCVHKHVGFLKHLMLRTGSDVKTGSPELMVNFVTSSYKPELLNPLVDKISSILKWFVILLYYLFLYPLFCSSCSHDLGKIYLIYLLYNGQVSIINNVNTSVGNTSVGEAEYILYGKSSISEALRGITSQISANSFFQTNTYQAEVLYRLIEECAGLRGDGSEVVLDLFCGTGTIGLTLAKNNATFIQGDLTKITDNIGDQFPRPDIVISDPNRPGMHLKLIKYLLKLRAPRLIYVSCNPATCARDLDYLCHGMVRKTGAIFFLFLSVLSFASASKRYRAGREKYKRMLQT
ncbi:hypothetical protein C5167_019291 [Papaver somniferum]|uniref:Methyltransferase domain-containing protein n=1 Tax=Papaver somniferum TaxID=3469 RepID=A0A4Y7ITW3_PAPSO|nr:hypothetical protein C5167_019291 [Papaver somniferum]